MNIFVVGASGLVGSHCTKVFQNNSWLTLGTHLNYPTSETVYFDPLIDNLKDFFSVHNFAPDAIVHCAALTNVDFCENNVETSHKATVLSTAKIVEFCKEAEIPLTYISTDYVFDGKQGPYSEDASVNPLNVYGAHKLEAERLVSSLKRNLILRITNVYGEELRSKNFIARLMEDLVQQPEKMLNLPYDQFATPIYAGDIANMVFLLLRDQKNGLYHLGSSDYYSRYHLAVKISSYFEKNKSVKFNPVQTINANQAAVRPLNGGLLNNKFLNEYPNFSLTNVDSYILKSLKNEL
ncbi:dTDP-4-dehydrorhamnose reductase [Pedobacter psychrotolerans]|uniref:dTDP-4-dehydrorhamnose reductase n=1 Tax=Pedobacter psychrotolerans TaxID=1843235 RepID=A0A4V2RZK4_9SPHI|nr:SDR family oxidoreductase [Pedobacter psychrotolerans]TCO26688.1 dTDP-4-dehydrorhamnose reductase [Pedobacter psychrotolerans]GGE55751.1 NAD(P)-dependent oxidoreductase [Pedobacter psychrotolerans]